MHTNNRFETFWEPTKTFIKANWPKFTDVELSKINGDYDVFLKYLKDLYNNFPLEEAIARGKLQKFFNDLDKDVGELSKIKGKKIF